MPKDTPPIIDLTDIIQEVDTKSVRRPEEDKLTDQVSDLMRDNSADDVELDDLLAQLNDDSDESVSSGPVVNPNERLDMPGMDDMDAVMEQFGESIPSKAKSQDDLDLDNLLAGLDEKPEPPRETPKGGPVVSVTDADLDDMLDDEPTPKKMAASADDDLDALLADLDSNPAPRKAPAPDDDLDALLDGLDDAPGRGSHTVKDTELDDLLDDLGAQEQPLKAGSLDDLLSDFDDTPKSAAEPKSAVKAESLDDDDLDALLDATAVEDEVDETELDMELSAAEEEVQIPDDGLDTADLNDLLDNLPAPPAPAPAAVAPMESTELPKLHEQLNAMAFSLQTALEQQQQLRERLDSLAAPATDAEAETLPRIEALETQFAAFAGELAGMQEQLSQLLTLPEADEPVVVDSQDLAEELGDAALSDSDTVQERLSALEAAVEAGADVDALAARVMDAMQQDIGKAAAAAAATVIREEILAMFANQEQ